MPKLNKTITTNVLEYGKTIVLTALIVGSVGFFYGIQFQKNSTVTVDNKVVLSSAVAAPQAETVKK